MTRARTASGKAKRKRTRKTRTAVVDDDSSSSASSSSSSADSSSEEEESSSDDKDAAQKGFVAASAPMSKAQRLQEQARQMDLDSEDEESDSDDASSSSSSSSNHTHAKEEERESDKRERRQHQYSPMPEPLTSYEREQELHKHHPSSSALTLESLYRQTKPTRLPMPSSRMSELAKEREAARQRLRENVRRRDEAGAKATPSSSLSVEQKKEQLQSIWMKSLIDEFGEELDALRKKDASLGAQNGSRMPLLIDALQSGAELYSFGPLSPESKVLPSLHQIDEAGFLLDHHATTLAATMED